MPKAELAMSKTGRILTALVRGVTKRCPHCGQGRLFSGWAHHVERCPLCGLIYERNPGDTWAFTVIGDRIPVGASIVLIYFGVFRANPPLGIALHYLSRIYGPDPADPVPPSPKDARKD